MRVAVAMSLAHLDRPFDYLVPVELDEQVAPGTRVRVRFAGALTDGFVLERVAASEHPGKLAFLERAVSAEPVLSPEIATLARAIADRYAGSLADVLRLAVPPRHARVEGEQVLPTESSPGRELADESGWARYRAGAAFLHALADGKTPRAVWNALPGEDWPARLAEAAAATDRGVVLVVPDARDLDRLDAALIARLGPDQHVCLSAALGPAERYRRFLRAVRAQTRVVIGPRAAAFAPVQDLGLVAIWDDGDDLHAEPRAPYPHAREVLLTRAQLAGAATLVGGFARTAEGQLLVETGWAVEIAADRAVLREHAPRVVPSADDLDRERDSAATKARLPSVAWRAARDALAAETPVLVQVPRRGYLPSVSCARCRTPGRCPICAGPFGLASASAVPTCRWCGHLGADYQCATCGARTLRAGIVGAGRTAEELGRAFPGVPVRTSGGDTVLTTVADGPALVVATPGAEPIAAYGAVLLLDTWALLTRADLRTGEETLRRWFAAAALARPDGQVVVVADGAVLPVQALLRWDPAGFAARELADRRELGFPPAVRMASVTGSPAAVAEFLGTTKLPEQAEVLGPVPVGLGQEETQERALVRVPRGRGPELAAALHAAAGVRSARKDRDPVRIQIDPLDLF